MSDNPLPRFRNTSALLTDLYELSMATVYDAEGMNGEAVFELFFRELPANRNYVLSAGQDECLRLLPDLRFTREEVDWLESLERFPAPFLRRLRELKFSGDVYAVPEGTVVFPFEPVIQIRAPLLEAQIIETLLLNRIHAQSVLASKAARIVRAADGRPVMDFGARKAQGTDGALNLARASYLAGAAGTSNLEAGWRYGIPVMGTMAHSYVQAFDDEATAFERFTACWPETTLLVDTWDSLRGVDRVIELMRKHCGGKPPATAIRLDSGDLLALSRAARERLDAAGLEHMKIVASSSLDEYRIRELLEAGAPIDAFGIGTRWAVSPDAPDLDFAYKMAEFDGLPRMKASSGKATWPGAKQVWRQWKRGRMTGDTITARDEPGPDGAQALLKPVIEGGERLPGALGSLTEIREHAQRQLDALPDGLHSLETIDTPYPVTVSKSLEQAREHMLSNFLDER